jgi:riboflavin kinase/FMN adenylyltransferase
MKISGKVIHGDGYGRTLGFPTANLEVLQTMEGLPPAGVYVGKADVGGIFYRTGILINPTGKVEAHLIGYDGDLYDKMMTLEVGEFVRPYRKFDTEADLINQITEDLKKC